MSEYEPKQVFQQPLKEENKPQETLFSRQEFNQTEPFVPAEKQDVSDTEALSDVDIEAIIRPSARKRWFMPTMLTAFVGLIGWQTADAVSFAYQSQDWLSLGWFSFLAVIAGAGAGKLFAELLTLRHLRTHFTQQEEAEAFIQANSVGQAKPFCEYLMQNAGIDKNNPTVFQWENHLNDAYSDAEVLSLFDLYVLKSLDEKAIQVISRSASESAVLVAVSPLAIADMLLVAWRNLTMLERLSRLYGVKLGYWSRIRLLRTLFINMAAAGASEVVIDASADLLSAGLAGKLSARAGQGIGIGILTARLGLQAMTLLRPLPWVPERKVKLTTIRKAIVSHVLQYRKR